MGKRLFVSLDLADSLSEAVREVQAPFATLPGIRITEPTQTHVTLKFLGETDEEQIPGVIEALETAVEETGLSPFTARFGGLGVLPEFDYISVIWIGAREGGTELTTVHEAVEAETVALGFEEERHDFTPHATIARMDHAEAKEEVQAILEREDPDVGAMNVSEITLTESELTPDGPAYTTLERIEL